ncbi:N-lysine methyltransferase KMT5A [Merluccius polli]|uniref:N-lysine methyltransferase KMT5A n=1 Tax=Merluccius polli TaxID=89951 RepID=A0AA47NW48_MERPO|nr:N-lysine methyltransferase KMT5A [Merluccius polli]
MDDAEDLKPFDAQHIDSSREDGSLGRLANDDHKSPNCVMKVIVNDRVHLCLFAVRSTEPGTEIVYNYGDSNWPWRKKENLENATVVSDEPKLFPDHVTNQGNLPAQIPQIALNDILGRIHGASLPVKVNSRYLRDENTHMVFVRMYGCQMVHLARERKKNEV